MTTRDLLSLTDLARMLKVNYRTARRYKRAGKLPPFIELPGGRPRWEPLVVAEWIRKLYDQ